MKELGVVVRDKDLAQQIVRGGGGATRFVPITVTGAASEAAALRAALPKTLPPVVRAGLVVGASALVFSLQGLHMYVRSMSGSAWLTANLLVVARSLVRR